jgi:hypothetical protein
MNDGYVLNLPLDDHVIHCAMIEQFIQFRQVPSRALRLSR